MAEYLIQDSTLKGIADAIRNRTGKSGTIAVKNIPSMIESMESLVDYKNEVASIVGNNNFTAFDKIRSVSFTKVETIDKYAFWGCTNLTTANFPLATTIERGAFSLCSKLSSIEIPLVTSIKTIAFRECGLQNLFLPVCTSIGQSAFMECRNLLSVDAPLLEYAGISAEFSSCSSLETVNLPKLSSITSSMFSGCTALKNVCFSSVVAINSYAFANCTSLEHIELPSLRTFIDESAFLNCSSLVAVVISNNNNSIKLGTNVFKGTPIENGTGYIYIQDSLVDHYKTETTWSAYASQIKPLSEYTPVTT